MTTAAPVPSAGPDGACTASEDGQDPAQGLRKRAATSEAADGDPATVAHQSQSRSVLDRRAAPRNRQTRVGCERSARGGTRAPSYPRLTGLPPERLEVPKERQRGSAHPCGSTRIFRILARDREAMVGPPLSSRFVHSGSRARSERGAWVPGGSASAAVSRRPSRLARPRSGWCLLARPVTYGVPQRGWGGGQGSGARMTARSTVRRFPVHVKAVP